MFRKRFAICAEWVVGETGTDPGVTGRAASVPAVRETCEENALGNRRVADGAEQFAEKTVGHEALGLCVAHVDLGLAWRT